MKESNHRGGCMRAVAACERLKELVAEVHSISGNIEEQARCIPTCVSNNEAESGLWIKMSVAGFARKLKKPETLIGDRID